ncbi:MAG: Glutamine--fructose-6-phosphate aminotransferase [isomerizing] [uncultured Acidimicrobiales bacterium]|uniref:Glutamine--fructose-6-phosphate aminotransferase [isomerizing] n=1 Tax=uncultured Acidimicrobiales bacterium TaxID=310071 RepID=A0A6J4J164_9ACTN|nr:MAG: Glutamine--fructose-6-phosphate aminotransferase [isomerizing] [uncultured Acidimicrobiales bacterium]
MCGIIAVLRRRSSREVPQSDEVLARLDEALSALAAGGSIAGLDAAAAATSEVNRLLSGVPGLVALRTHSGMAAAVEERAAALGAQLRRIEIDLDSGRAGVTEAELEDVNAAVLALKDAVWAVQRDRLRTAVAVTDLAGEATSESALAGYLAVQEALSALDRLEVRGRDSAGLHLVVDGHGLDTEEPGIAAELARRADPLFASGAVCTAHGRLSFVYKAAAEIGELGDNSAHLRAAIRQDQLLRRALAAPEAQMTVVGHTRWASVGIISEPNAHPLNSVEETDGLRPYVIGALNGDVDNYAELREQVGLKVAPEITTDAKVIPTLLARRRAEGGDPVEAFRATVSSFEGSVAIAAQSVDRSDEVLLALRGSGQALYVGLAEDAFVVASEPYGIVELTSRYLRLDGESASGTDGSSGQIVALDRSGAGTLDGITRVAYDGTPLPATDSSLARAEITTRDIDRGGAPHFLLKEMHEAPLSIRKTLRGKIEDRRGLLAVRLPTGTLPEAVRQGLADGRLQRILVTGQGTAAVAGQAVAEALRGAFHGTAMRITAITAAELSGFGLDDDMSDTLLIAISQSGTSTDTNRTVDLLRSRGAVAVAIVNRRNSDLTDKADGVLYTSDGRDVEMAVPSTKAFYAQIAAGVLLAWGLADVAGVGDRHRAAELLTALRELPEAMETVLERRPLIAAAAQTHGPPHRYWALVGNGPNRVAAEELRIKLSELCYKSISCDITENKKHIDLSCEPMILVCAAGLDGANADDVTKEVAIFRAHKATPVVIASDGENRFDAAADVLHVPKVHPALDFVLSAMAGHLFGYEAAVAIDAQGRLLRELRGVVEECVGHRLQPHELLESLATGLQPVVGRFFADLHAGVLDGHLEASTASRMASLLRYAMGTMPLEIYEVEYGKVASPGALVDDLLDALSDGIDELTRPIDAIKHQAKTVTVGTSRSEETYADVPLVGELLATGTTRDRVGYRAMRTLAALDAAVAEVTGYTRYLVLGDPNAGTATIEVIDKGGVARDIPSRTEHEPALMGTKNRAATSREVTVSRSDRDGRTTVIIPETKDNQVTGITLLHVRFHDRLEPAPARQVLTGYQNRYNAIVDAVTETQPAFADERLGEVAIVDLLVDPVRVLAAHWRSAEVEQ